MAASTYFDQVQQLYIAYFGRPADPAGLAYWAANIDAANGSVAQVIAGFSTSDESQLLYAGATTTQKVSSIYLALFNRSPEPAGLTYWVGQIDSGSVSQAQAAYLIERSAGPDDAAAVANKLAAAKAFTAQLDTPAEIAGFAGTVSAAYARAFLSSVDATPASLANATAPAALAMTVAIASNTLGPTTPDISQTYTLTASADTVAGSPANDIINSTVAGGFGSGDVIDGGAGTDTLTVTGSGSISSTGVTVTNVETASFTSADNIALDTTGWTGLTSLTTHSDAGLTNLTSGAGTAIAATVLDRGAFALTVNGGSNVAVTASGSTSGAISVGATLQPTGTVTITNTSSAPGTMGGITVNGGTTVNITQVAGNTTANTTTTQGVVTVNGDATTTTVTINNTARSTQSIDSAGVVANSVTITDVNADSATLAGTITNVSVSNVTSTSILGNALTSLSVQGGSGNIIIDNSGLTVATNKVLNLTLNGQTGGGLVDSGIYTTLNVTATGKDSTLANITDSALTTLDIAGSKTLALTSTLGMTALQTVKVSGSASFVGDLSGATVTSVDASGTTGNMTVVKLDGSKASYSGGAGVDLVTLTGTPTKAISGGDGSADVLTIGASAASSLSNATLVSGFEQVTLTGANMQIVDFDKFVGATTLSTSGGSGLTLGGFATGDTLQLTGAGSGYATLSDSALSAGSNDTLNLKLTDGSGTGVNFASNIITSNIENIAISVNDTQGTPLGGFLDAVGLQGNFNSITVSGNAGLNLTTTSAGLTSVDASGITLGSFNWTFATPFASPANVTVKGSATGTNTIDLSAATQAEVTYIGGTGASTITTGSGDDTVTVGNNITGGVTIDFGSGNDTLKFNGVASTTTGIVLAIGLGANDVIDFSGVRGTAANSAQNNLGSMLTGQTTLDGYLNAAATLNVSAGSTSVLHWFQFNGNTYITQDTSTANTFVAGSDTVIELSGLVDLSTAAVTPGTGIVILGNGPV